MKTRNALYRLTVRLTITAALGSTLLAAAPGLAQQLTQNYAGSSLRNKQPAPPLTLGAGGSGGIRSQHQLASAAFQPYQTVFGEDAYPTIPEKAAAHAFFLAESQPFLDGNKRTAALALTVFLDLNDYLFNGTVDNGTTAVLGADTVGNSEGFSAGRVVRF